MAGIRTLPKLTGTGIDPQIAQWAAQIVDTLNPALRELATATDFRWLEVEGVNGAAPTFALQLAQGFGWTTIAQFDTSGRLVQPAWQAPTLINSWANAATFLPAGFMRDALGFVHLRGQLQTGVPPSVAFVLPVGYRPAARIDLNTSSGTISIRTDGSVLVLAVTAGSAGLDGIHFDLRA